MAREDNEFDGCYDYYDDIRGILNEIFDYIVSRNWDDENKWREALNNQDKNKCNFLEDA